jgi:DNA-binding MarR family transcriptional regulator
VGRFAAFREPDRTAREKEPPRELRERSYELNDEEMIAMRLVGSFRSVDAQEIRSAKVDRLVSKGLMDRKSLVLQRSGKRTEVLILTPKGRDFLRAIAPEDDPQRYYAGLVKPAEVAHDLAIYPAYKREAEQIEKAGGRIKRVVLDYEFKGIAASRMNRTDGPAAAERRAELAAELDLPIVDDHLALPDLRIEYEDAGGQEQHRDVEVVTRHYRGAHLAGKQQTGFRLVSADGPRKSIEDDHHLAWI